MSFIFNKESILNLLEYFMIIRKTPIKGNRGRSDKNFVWDNYILTVLINHSLYVVSLLIVSCLRLYFMHFTNYNPSLNFFSLFIEICFLMLLLQSFFYEKALLILYAFLIQLLVPITASWSKMSILHASGFYYSILLLIPLVTIFLVLIFSINIPYTSDRVNDFYMEHPSAIYSSFMIIYAYTLIKYVIEFFSSYSYTYNQELLFNTYFTAQSDYTLTLDYFFNPSVYLDELGILFMILSFALVVLCIFFLWPTLIETDTNGKMYVIQLLLLLFQLQLTFTSSNLLVFFIAFESLLIPMIMMIAVWGSKNNRQANNYLVFYTMFSAIPMLLAIIYINTKFNTLNISSISFLIDFGFITLSWEEEMYLWFSFFLGFAVKTPMVPFHIWLPKAHVDAPTVGSVILAGLLLKIGLIGFIRVLLPLFPKATIFFSPYVAALATVGVIYSSLITLRQIDMKRIIAYSSVAHMNMAMVSLCSLNAMGIYSSIYLMISHGLVASGLFFLVGFLYNRFHVRSIEYYSGLGTIMPVMCMFFFVLTLANIAFPLTSGFIGEFLLLLGISISNFYLGFLNAFSMLFTTVYSLLLFGRVFLGELNPWFQNLVETQYIFDKVKQNNNYNFSGYGGLYKSISIFDIYYYEMNIIFTLISYIFFLGIYPQLIFQILINSSYLNNIIFNINSML